MDSGAELKFAELLDLHKVKWVKNTDRFFVYTDPTGKKRKYFPDFFLPEYDWWVEIKGGFYKRDNDLLKLRSVGQNIEMMLSNEIRLPVPVRQL